ncbi:hypothetical protein IEQ34_022822 [Dendrobium chrysotoxum]|uniref:AIR9-like A9 domain-containing protein n=1 Tax=Dendrobium chrysotoxum TaxID=161865 RepID=A0AAV7FYT8_DENCH|nr:hypothetical protein IEQ34_022822 [Dendrobium chrysotoxum]
MNRVLHELRRCSTSLLQRRYLLVGSKVTTIFDRKQQRELACCEAQIRPKSCIQTAPYCRIGSYGILIGSNNGSSLAVKSSPEPVPPDMRPSSAGYIVGNDDAAFWSTSTDSLVRHQFRRGSSVRLLKDDANSTLLDHELMELSSKVQQQEEEIMFLRKQIRDASSKELQLLNEKHVLERKLSELRTAIDEKQDDAISDSMKELSQRKGCIKEKLKLTNELKRLFQHMKWKMGPNAGISEMHLLLGNQPRVEISNNGKLATLARRPLSQPGLDSNTNEFQGYDKYPFDFPVEGTPKLKHIPPLAVMNAKGLNNAAPDFGYQFIMDQPRELQSAMEVGGAATPNVLENNAVEAAHRRETVDPNFYIPSPLETQASPFTEVGEPSLPGIEVFQIIGEAKPGCTLRACGYPTNGTYLCIFQWVRHLENGTRQSIEGATVPDYVVTADDVDTYLAVDCIPMDESGRQGELVSLFANNQNKITCDSDMQHEIETHLSSGRAVFNVMLLIKVPNGQSTQFVLIGSDGTTLPFSTSGTSQPHSLENDIRLRDIIVLSMRYFQSKAVDGKRKGKA